MFWLRMFQQLLVSFLSHYSIILPMSRRTSQSPSHADSNRPAYIPPGVRRTIRHFDNRQFETQRTDGLQPYPRIDTVSCRHFVRLQPTRMSPIYVVHQFPPLFISSYTSRIVAHIPRFHIVARFSHFSHTSSRFPHASSCFSCASRASRVSRSPDHIAHFAHFPQSPGAWCLVPGS